MVFYREDFKIDDEEVEKAVELLSRARETSVGRSIEKVVAVFRDKSRARLIAHLRKLEIKVEKAARGLPEEEVGAEDSSFENSSCGLINIDGGYIRWINIRRDMSSSFDPVDLASCVLGSPPLWFYCVHYCIPDPRIELEYQWLRIKSVREKSPPLLGHVSGMHWKGDDRGLYIIHRLNNDYMLKKPIMESCDVLIRAHPKHKCWTITNESEAPYLPSREQWECYQVIARHLLAKHPRVSDFKIMR